MNVSSLTSSSTAPCVTQRGFTLVELIVVVVILAVLATLVIPQVTGVEAESRLAVSVANMGDINRTINGFNTLSKGKYPDGWDSLLDSAAATPTIYAGNGNAQQNSGVFAGWLLATAITTEELASLRRVSSNVVSGGPGGSLWTLYDHDPAVANPLRTTDGTPVRRLDTVTAASPLSSPNCVVVNDAVAAGQAVYRSFNLVPDPTYRLLALGVGPRCTLVGNKFSKLTEVPVADDVTPNNQYWYRRFVALFKVFTAAATGLPFAQYVGCVTSYGKNHSALRDFMTQ